MIGNIKFEINTALFEDRYSTSGMLQRTLFLCIILLFFCITGFRLIRTHFEVRENRQELWSSMVCIQQRRGGIFTQSSHQNPEIHFDSTDLGQSYLPSNQSLVFRKTLGPQEEGYVAPGDSKFPRTCLLKLQLESEVGWCDETQGPRGSFL